MRLGLSTVLTAALAVGLMACSSSTGDGEGGSGGAGAGGDDSSSSQGGAGTGGDDTATGTGGGGGGDTGDGVCDYENTAVDANGEAICDVDCDFAFPGLSGDFAQCTTECDLAGDGSDCGDGLSCFDLGDGTGACLYSCADGAACPGTGLYVCDQEALFCDPDGAE